MHLSTPAALLLTALTFACHAAPAGAVVVNVSARATGLFGDQFPDAVNMVNAYDVTLPGGAVSETIRITPAGLIDIGSGPVITADGISINVGATEFSPIEEKVVDVSGIFGVPRLAPNYGALTYAFIPAALAGDPSFVPRDEDLTPVGISSNSVLFAGVGPTDVTFFQAGTLYLGINDTFASNNSGAFSVTVETIALEFPPPVPEPTAGALLSLGAIGLASTARWRRPNA